MITITISDIELYDNDSEQFVMSKGGTFRFEHSLDAIAKWEAKWKLPFLNSKLTNAQLNDYYQTMCLDKGLTKKHLIPEVVEKLTEYINDEYTATTFQNENTTPSSQKIMTCEVIFALMVAAHVPFECSGWNINRLMALLRVISIQSEEPKKMTPQEVLEQNRKLNEERKRKYNTKG